MTLKSRSSALAGTVFALGLLGIFQTAPLHAQARPAIVRDQDNPDLAPFTASVSFNLISLNTQQLLTTVPAGKRLVIDYVSYESGGPSADQLVFLALRAGQLGPITHVFPINPPHASVTPGLTLQDGSTSTKVYYEAGQDVWVSASVAGTGRDMNFYVTGHYITP